jgi:hypothetical protein
VSRFAQFHTGTKRIEESPTATAPACTEGSPCLKSCNSHVLRSFSIRRLSKSFPWHSTDAWKKIQQSGSEFARPAYANAMREEIAKHVIDMAGRGEMDQRRLSEDAIEFLAANYRY